MRLSVAGRAPGLRVGRGIGTMSIHASIPFISFLAYCSILGLNLLFSRNKSRNHFALFLMCGIAWSLSSFLLRIQFMPDQAMLWGRVLMLSIPALAIAYYRFVLAFLNHRPNWQVYLGYATLGAFVIAAALGHIPRSVTFSESEPGLFTLDRGPLLYPLALVAVTYVLMAITALIRRRRMLVSSLERNRISYLMMGITSVTLFGLTNMSNSLSILSIDHLGNVANSCLIGYAIMRHKLLEVSIVIRRGLAYSVSTLPLTALYFFSFFLLQSLFRDWQTGNQLLALGVTAIIAAVLHRPVASNVNRIIDRLFMGKSYDYRQRLASFSADMGHVLDLEELAQSLLQLTTKAVGATQACLMLPSRAGFAVQFGCTSTPGEPVSFVKLDRQNPIIAWMERERRPLMRDSIETLAEFQSLTEHELRDLDAVGCELLSPVMKDGKLVGLLLLGEKESKRSYTSEDLDLLMILGRDVAVMVDNARRHAAVTVEANTDELTALFNHRVFHDRLEQEINRSSRFGLSFSLLMIDIDLFKTYNDAYGHLAGDGVLRKVAECISISRRRTDLAFRYGGEEFAVILPEANAREAFKVAERLRRTVESKMESFGILLTISVGVASWPRDAVMATEMIKAADAALYYAKQTGRNCTQLASQVPTSGFGQVSWADGQASTLNLVYALAATVDAKDHYTYGHSKKVSKYAGLIGEAMGLSQTRVAALRNSGLLHDIGKIGVADAVLRKPGRLDKEEWQQIRYPPRACGYDHAARGPTRRLPACHSPPSRARGREWIPGGIAGRGHPFGGPYPLGSGCLRRYDFCPPIPGSPAPGGGLG